MTNFYGELVIRFTSDTSGLAKGVKEAQAQTASVGKAAERSLGKTGLAMQNVGRTMTQYYTLPVVAGLGYATYAAYKYQKAMIQVQNLTGLSATQAAKFSDEIRKASAEIGNAGGPQAAAEAFYFLASSGLDAKEAMNALRVSMKASVAGMGEIQVLADVVTSAMNSYGHSAYSAEEAMNILMRTIEVGKAEPEALASSLGRIMPIANQLKVSLQELGGNVAALTLGGLSSAEAVTALRGTMVALVSPAKMSIDELAKLKLTYKDVTKSIAEKGLLPTLKMLWEATDHNMLSLRKIIPNVRATTGVMSLLGANYKKNLEIIDRVNDSQGKLNETFKTASQTDVAKFNRALNQLKSTFIEVGAVVLPLVTMLVREFGKLVGVFETLPPWLQKTSVYFLAITAAAMPLLSVLGSVFRAVGLLTVKRAAAVAASAAETATNAALAASNGAVAASETAVAGATAGRAATTAAANNVIKASTLASIIQTRHYSQAAVEAGLAAKLFGTSVGAASVALLGAAAVGAVGGIAIGQAIRDWNKLPPTMEETIARMERTAKQSKVDVPIKLVTGDTNLPKVRRQIQSLKDAGKLVITVDDVSAYISLQNLSDYVKDDNRWKIPINVSHVTFSEEVDRQIQENAAKLGLPVAAHAPKTQRQLGLEAIEVKDIFEKIPPVQVPITWKTMSRAEQTKFINNLTPKQKVMLQWEMSKAPIKMPKVDIDSKHFQGQVSNMRKWLNDITKSRIIPVRIKREQVTKGLNVLKGELDRVQQRAKKGGWDPELSAKAGKLNSAIKNANQKLDALGKKNVKVPIGVDDQATQPAADIHSVLVGTFANPITQVVNIKTSRIPPRSWGAIIKKPELALVGEAGPEVIIPLTKPQRAAQLLEQSGLAKYSQARVPERDRGPARPTSQPVATAPAEVHYHNHLTLPQGTVVSDIDRFGRQISPYVERSTYMAERRRARGRG